MPGLNPAGVDRAAMQAVPVENLAWAARQAPALTLLIEPLNGRDMPGYLLNRQDHAHEIVAAVGAPNVAVQMGLYHCQIVDGDLSAGLRRHLDQAHPTKVGHLQFAGVPDRHEPDEGDLAYAHLFEINDRPGWTGWMGSEYRPKAGTRDGLGWFRERRAFRGDP